MTMRAVNIELTRKLTIVSYNNFMSFERETRHIDK